MDCMQGMKDFPDKYFDLAIVDPPYGIGENEDKNHTRGKLAKSKDYKAFSGMDLKPPSEKYFDELFRVSKNQIIWGQTILSAKCRLIAVAGLFGIKLMEITILLIVNLRGLRLILQ